MAGGCFLVVAGGILGALCGAFGSVPAAFAAFYYATCIAELPADAGGPVSNPHPVWRARATLLLAIALVVGSGLLLFRALKSVPERPN